MTCAHGYVGCCAECIASLRPFIGYAQLDTMQELAGPGGEEREFFIDKVAELALLTKVMPRQYGQNGLGDAAVAHLHYFCAAVDWWICERDSSHAQHQAHGMAALGGPPELGYVSIYELIKAGVELDLHWTPKTLGEIRAELSRGRPT